MASSPSKKQPQDKKGVPLEREFLRVFQRIQKKLTFESAALDVLADHMLDTLIQAATSKCVDFNIAANQFGKKCATSLSFNEQSKRDLRRSDLLDILVEARALQSK